MSASGARPRSWHRPRFGAPSPRIVGRLLSRSFWVVIVLLVLSAVSVGAYSVLTHNWTIAPILSGSMKPGFPVGGVVVAQRVPVADLAVGDVIIFQSPYQPSEQVVHRIVDIQPDQSGQAAVKTKGDANAAEDPWTVNVEGNSIYVAQFTLPLLGYVAVNISPGVDLIIGGVILLLVVISSVLSRERRTAARNSLKQDVGGSGSAAVDRIPV